MKKALFLILALALVFSAAAVPALADGTASLVVSSDKQTLMPGEEVSFTVSLSNGTGAGVAGLSFTVTLPEELTYVSSSVDRDHFQLVNYDAASGLYSGTGTATLAGVTDAAWTVMTLTCRAADDAQSGTVTVSAAIGELYDPDINDIACTGGSAAVEIATPATAAPAPTVTTAPTTPATQQPAPQNNGQNTNNNTKKDSVPKTGEESYIAILAVAAVLGAAGIVIFGRKKNGQKND